MNPLDLLNTNLFVTKPDIEFNKNNDTRDKINILKTIDRPFPKNFNRNYEPIITNNARDFLKDRYKKLKSTLVCINSADRNKKLYPKPNKYNVNLGKLFNSIESIELKDIRLYRLPLYNLGLTWKYPDESIESIIIPNGIYSVNELRNTMMEYMNQTINNGFYIEINANLNQIIIINRIESPEIIAIQTLLIDQDDIFGLIVNPSKNGIYITVNSDLMFSQDPIIPTGIPNIGGLSKQLFNFKTFIKDDTYEFVDTITINGKNYLRYFLKAINENSQEINANYSQNILLNDALKNFTTFQGIYNNIEANIGPAREFTFDFKNSNLLALFNWYECDDYYRYVLTNQTDYNIAYGCFRLEYNIYNTNQNTWNFNVFPYILIKIIMPSMPEDTIANNTILSEKSLDYNQNKLTNIFAKIILTNPIKIESIPLKYIEYPLDNLTQLEIQFIDPFGNPICDICENLLSIEIIEIVEVLKDTLIDSKHGEANITGTLKI